MGLEALAAGDTLHDDLWDAGKTYLQMHHDKVMQSRSYNYQTKLNEQMASLASEARRDSAPAMVEGLKRAGLHPALASGVGFGSVSSGGSVGSSSSSLGAGGRSSQMGALAVESLKYQESERALMDAQTANLNAEAEGKEIDNDNKRGSNFVSESILRTELEDMQANSPEYSNTFRWSSALLKSSRFNQGILDAFSKSFEALPKITEANAKVIANKLSQTIDELQLFNLQGDDDLSRRARVLVASLPAEQARQVREATDNIVANTLLLVAEMGKTDKQVELINKQKELIDKEMANLDTVIRATHHKDLISMWEDGEYTQMFIGAALEGAPRIIQGGLSGLGLYGGARTLKKSPQPKGTFMSNLNQ